MPHHKSLREPTPIGNRLLAPLLTVGILLGCQSSHAPSEVVEQTLAQDADQIAWFDGDIEGAFALAEQSGRPLFLYWGAEWCPPCHYLKKKIFQRPEFVVRMSQFIPVYLDGDTERAQILGEELDVQGYPTVIIFNPLGEEVMRMPSTVPVEQYAALLDAAVESQRPLKLVLDEVLMQGPAAASPRDLELLAFYSWSQDSKIGLDAADQLEAFHRLYRETPPTLPVIRSRFLGLLLLARSEPAADDGEGAAPLAEAERALFVREMHSILETPELRDANLSLVNYGGKRIIDFLTPTASAERQALVSSWQAAATALEDDPDLTVADRLGATMSTVVLQQLGADANAESRDASAAIQKHVRERVAWATESVTSESELQAVVNTMAYLLEESGLTSEAEALLLDKMNQTAAPYYFMSWLATLKEESGDQEDALAWYRKAYDSSSGRYSRFRWGSSYLRKLIDLAPKDTERIEADSIEVLGEALQHSDAFAGGSFAGLKRLESAYLGWNEDGIHEDSLLAIREYVRASCDKFPSEGEDSQRERCESFLDPESAPSTAQV